MGDAKTERKSGKVKSNEKTRKKTQQLNKDSLFECN